MDFETAFDKYKNYIRQIAGRVDGWDNLNMTSDIVQELSIELWRCLEKYEDKDDEVIERIFKSAFHNRIVNLLRSKRIERQGLVSIERNRCNPNMKISETLSKNIMTEKEYQEGIAQVLMAIPEEGAMKTLEMMNIDNNKQFIKGGRKAFDQIQTYLRD